MPHMLPFGRRPYYVEDLHYMLAAEAPTAFVGVRISLVVACRVLISRPVAQRYVDFA